VESEGGGEDVLVYYRGTSDEVVDQESDLHLHDVALALDAGGDVHLAYVAAEFTESLAEVLSSRVRYASSAAAWSPEAVSAEDLLAEHPAIAVDEGGAVLVTHVDTADPFACAAYYAYRCP
jgi:hypothetical protein